MRRALVEKLPTIGLPSKLADEEATHLIRVLRLADGAEVEALDGRGGAAVCKLRVTAGSRSPAWLEFERAAPGPREGEIVPLDLELAWLKADTMAWAVEKAVELGARSLTPVFAERGVVRPKDADRALARLSRIADQSLKQCGRRHRLEIRPPRALAELRADPARAVAEPSAAVALSEWLEDRRECRVLIGPEGGWTAEETACLASIGTPVSLGPLTLRAETAAVAACAVMMGTRRAARE